MGIVLDAPDNCVYSLGIEANNTSHEDAKMAKFEIGKTYSTRSICDSDCIFQVTIVARTKATVTTADGKTFRIAKKETTWNNAETIFPTGRYSMAPAIKAA